MFSHQLNPWPMDAGYSNYYLPSLQKIEDRCRQQQENDREILDTQWVYTVKFELSPNILQFSIHAVMKVLSLRKQFKKKEMNKKTLVFLYCS
jgi:hypothetical protein